MIRTQKDGLGRSSWSSATTTKRDLDHPDFAIIWQTANDIGMPVNVHPGTGALKAWGSIPVLPPISS